jgi:uncharacterized protein DUF4365
MKNEQAWYLRQRAEALALVYLTRRSDLLIHQQGTDYGIDFIVEIVKENHVTRKTFGLQIKARTTALTNNMIKQLKIRDLHFEQGREELPFPLCLFFFTMENDEAFYKWLSEPVITEDGRPKLRQNTSGDLNKLDTAALDTIVRQVDQWYDALFKALAA